VHIVIVASGVQQSGGGTSNFQLWGVPVITAVLFYLLGVASTVYLKRPKLAVVGSGHSGGGGPEGFQVYNISIRNNPGHLGMKIAPTVIFGRRVHGQHWFGWPVMREPAKVCTASLYDDAGNYVAPLWWRDPSNGANVKIVLDLDSGEQADLFFFAQRNDDVPNYYPYERGSDGNPVMPPVKLSGARRFNVRLSYADGHQKCDLKYTVSSNYRDGRLVIRSKWHKR
jgi:hypothetical protein